MGSQPNRKYIVEAKPKDIDKIVEIRDELYDSLPSTQEHYYKLDPHLTIIPPFTMTELSHSELESLVDSYQFSGSNIHISGAGIWPSLQDPRVFLLDAEIGFIDERESLYEELANHGAEFEYPPSPFHISLFKCINGHSIPQDFNHILQENILEKRESWDTTIEYCDVQLTD